MRRLQVVIREVDDQRPDPPKDLATCDLPTADRAALKPETALDDLEATTHATGNAILRGALQAQWEGSMPHWPSSIASVFPPPPRSADGHAPVKVARRFGTLERPARSSRRWATPRTACRAMPCGRPTRG